MRHGVGGCGEASGSVVSVLVLTDDESLFGKVLESAVQARSACCFGYESSFEVLACGWSVFEDAEDGFFDGCAGAHDWFEWELPGSVHSEVVFGEVGFCEPGGVFDVVAEWALDHLLVDFGVFCIVADEAVVEHVAGVAVDGDFGVGGVALGSYTWTSVAGP